MWETFGMEKIGWWCVAALELLLLSFVSNRGTPIGSSTQSGEAGRIGLHGNSTARVGCGWCAGVMTDSREQGRRGRNNEHENNVGAAGLVHEDICRVGMLC